VLLWWSGGKIAEENLQQHKKGFNSLVILGAWIFWKQRNACVFDEVAPNVQRVLFQDDLELSRSAHAKVGSCKGLLVLTLLFMLYFFGGQVLYALVV